MINISKIAVSKEYKVCDGCSKIIYPTESYIASRFSIDEPGTNLVRMISVSICGECITVFEDIESNTFNESV